MAEKKEKGPLGLGDPRDLRLTDIEREITIPRYIKKKAAERCKDEEARRNRCMVKYGIIGMMVCRRLRMEMDKCLDKWSHNPELVQQCTDSYLYGRSRYRTEGDDANIAEEILAREQKVKEDETKKLASVKVELL